MISSVEDTNLLPEIQELLKDILYNESLSENAVKKLGQLIEKLDAVLTPPSLPTRISVKTSPVYQANAAEVFDITSQEFLKEQRELSRQGTVWKGHDFIPESARLFDNNSRKSPQINEKSEGKKREELLLKYDKDAIYEKIDSCGVEEKSLQNAKRISQIKASMPIRLDNPPPVPERKGRLTSYERNVASPIPDRHRSSNKGLVWVHDLQTPLYSGLLRNVRSNTKQWCVIKRHILYLFNDLNEPASFMADLHEYEVFKDPEEPLMFRVTRLGEPSIVLAAVDEKQYQLWLHAFRNAKFLVDSEDGRLDNAGELGDYSEFKDSVGFDEEDCSDDEADYEKPDEMMDKLKHTVSSEVYEVMTSYDTSGVAPQSSYNYEEIGCPTSLSVHAKITIDDNADYSAMPLPPTPDVLPPKLPPRTTRLPLDAVDNNDSESESSDASLSGSFDSFSTEEINLALDQNLTYNQVKNKRKKEFDFFHDLSAVFCGVLHQRRMLAVWQKRFCKVKDQCLFCYRSLDVTEPCLRVHLHGYQLDRAEETWKSFAFKMYKDNSDVYYFAAESRSDLIKWLSVLAKETNKEKFLPVDGLERRRAYTTAEIYSESNTSNESLTFPHAMLKKTSTDINTSSEFENDSIDSEENNISKIQKQKSLDDPDVIIQGFLLRKFQTHWSRRWCCIKNERFFSYKQSIHDHPDVKIFLKHAVLTIPHDVDANEANSCFKLHYEGNQTIVMNAISKEDWLAWTNTLRKFVGSENEEKFLYTNAPPLRRSLSDSLKVTSECEINEDTAENSYYPISDEPPLSVPLVIENSPKSETEIKDSIYCGIVNELQALKQSFQHIEHFLVLTKEKWLKFYSDVTATVPRTQYNALNIQVVNEAGSDPLILRLHIEPQNKEVTLKTNSARECENWKNAFLKVHYEQIDADGILNDKLTENLTFPPQVTNKTKSNEPVLLLLNKNLLNTERKKMKEQNADRKYTLEKSKSLPRQSIIGTRKPSLDPILSISKEDKQALTDQQKKSFSALIRSFTVDTLTRKNKNKSYVVNKEDSPLLKETQRGHLKQVIVKNAKENLEDRFCRISGKVFYCFKSESDLKPLFKIPLKNAAIEEFSDLDIPQFRFQVTDLDSGKEHLFSLGSDFELNQWTTALFGDDKLHFSHDSPTNSNKILLVSNLDTGDRTSKSLSSIPVKSIDASVFLDSPNTSVGDSLNTQQDYVNSLNVEKIIPEPNVKKTITGDSTSNDNILLENSSDMKSSALRLLKRTGNEEVRLQGYFFEIVENSHVQRWLVLKDTILEIFSDIHDQQPINTIQLSSHFIMNDVNESSAINSICLKDEKNSLYIFVASADVDCQLWKSELSAIQSTCIQSRGLTYELNSNTSVTLRKKQRKLSKHKQASMLLLNDDLKVLQKYERCEDPSNISGGLTELFPYSNQKWKKHDRFCWICQGVFYVSKFNNPKKILKSIDLSEVSVMDESDPAGARFAFRLDYKQDNKPKFALFQTSNQPLAEKWMVAVSMGILFHRLSGANQDRKSFKNEDTHEDFEFFDFSKPSVERTSKFDLLESRDLKKEISKEMTENEADPKDTRLLVEAPSSEKPKQPVRSSNESSIVTAVSLPESNLTHVESKTSELFTNKREQTDNQVVPLTSDALNLTFINNSESAMSCEMNSLEENKLSASNDNINEVGELLDNIPEKENADETFKNIKGILRQQESIRRAILRRQSTKLKKPPPKIKPKPIRLSASKLILPTTVPHGTADIHLVDMEKYKEQLENEKDRLTNCIKDINNVASDSKTQMLNSHGAIEESVSSNELKVQPEDIEKLRARLHQIEIELKSVYKNINRKVATNIRESNTFDKTISRINPALHLHKTLSNTSSVPFDSKVNNESCLSESIIENDEVLLCNPIEELSNTQSVII